MIDSDEDDYNPGWNDRMELHCSKCGKRLPTDSLPASMIGQFKVLCSMDCADAPKAGSGRDVLRLLPGYLKGLFALLLILHVLLSPQTAFGQSRDFVPPSVVTMPPGEDRIVPVRKGEPAPFDGQVFSTDTAMRWGFWLEQYQARLPLDVETQRQLDQIKIDYLQGVLEVERDRAAELEDTYRSEIKELRSVTAPSQPFYDTFWFGLTTGLVLTTLAVGVAAYAVAASP